MRRSEFEAFHPLVSFLCFAFIILFSMLFMNPVCHAISLICGFVYSVILGGIRSVKTNLRYMLPVLFLSAIMNPLFNHAGVHTIAYFPNGNQLTLESILYGLSTACMIISVVCWFSCYNKIMTSDKIIYLFGRIIPSLSLVFSMILRFIPRLMSQLKEISNARKCIINDKSRIRNGLAVLSALTTQALENSVETADSMKSRGYGLPHRTSFSNFRFDLRDGGVLACILASAVYILFGFGTLRIKYFPTISKIPSAPYAVSVYAVYFILCTIPSAAEIFYKRRVSA